MPQVEYDLKSDSYKVRVDVPVTKKGSSIHGLTEEDYVMMKHVSKREGLPVRTLISIILKDWCELQYSKKK